MEADQSHDRILPPLVIIGGSGHAKVVADILREVREFRLVGYVAQSAGPPLLEEIPCLGTDDCLRRLRNEGVRHAFVAVGHNASRLRLSRLLAAMDFEMPSAISAGAIVSATARIGQGVALMPGAVIAACATICDFAIVNTRASIDHDSVVGIGAHVAPGVSACGNVTIGELAFVGAGAVLVPGVSVGPRAKVGAGAVVIRDVPADATAVGVPARIVRQGYAPAAPIST